VKAAATHLGVPTSTMYQLINSGEIAHVLIGSRRYVSYDQLTAFIDAHSHTGYTPSR
jgi:excisionase family DNA binding protein